MPELPFLRRARYAEARAADAVLEPSADAASVPAELAAVRELLMSAADAAATPAELTGQEAALSAFSLSVAKPSRRPLRRLRRPVMISSLLTAKLLAAGVAAAAVGGTAAAAYTGSLPAPAQRFAHNTIGAPAPDDSTDSTGTGDSSTAPTATPSSTPVGPDATGHAAFGLCTAYAAAQKHGSSADKSIAFRNLATAAGGADKIAAYCATVPHPGSTNRPTDKPSHPTGKSTSHPTGKPTSLPAPAESHTPSGNGATHRP